MGEVDVQALQLEVGGTIVASQKYQTAIPHQEISVEGVSKKLTGHRRQDRAHQQWSACSSSQYILTIGGLFCCAGEFFGQAWHVPESGTDLVTLQTPKFHLVKPSHSSPNTSSTCFWTSLTHWPVWRWTYIVVEKEEVSTG